jgi:Kef-type K+ transport system membrane component KefB
MSIKCFSKVAVWCVVVLLVGTLIALFYRSVVIESVVVILVMGVLLGPLWLVGEYPKGREGESK